MLQNSGLRRDQSAFRLKVSREPCSGGALDCQDTFSRSGFTLFSIFWSNLSSTVADNAVLLFERLLAAK